MNITTLPRMNATPVKFGACGNHGGKKASGSVAVAGIGSVEKDPDVMSVQVHVQEQGKDREAVTRALNTKSEAILKQVKALKIEGLDLKSNISVQPWTEWENNKQVKKGFQGSFVLSAVEHNSKGDTFADHAAKIANIAVDNDGNFSGPNYALSPKRQRAAAREALAEAYGDALKQAQRVAKTGGFALNEIPVSVVIGSPNTGGMDHFDGGGLEMAAMAPMAGGRSAKRAAAVSSGAFEYAPITVSSPQVSLRYAIEARKDEVTILPATQPAGKLDKTC